MLLLCFSLFCLSHYDHIYIRWYKIQKLSCIISESSSTNLNEKNEIESILHSLKALQWHFQCPLCSNELEQTHISTECLHRFCKECLLNKQATTMKVSLTSCVVAYDKNHCILTKCPFCIETTEKNTKFIPDKQYESIVSFLKCKHWFVRLRIYSLVIKTHPLTYSQNFSLE